MISRFREFVETVSETYRLLGFTVRADVELRGRKVDLLVTRVIAGLGLTRIAIEVKYTSKLRVGLSSVNKIYANYQTLLRQGVVDRLIIVSNIGFTQEARSSKKSPLILFITLSEIVKQVFQIDPYVDRSIRDFDLNTSSSSFIDLRVRREDIKTNTILDASYFMELWLTKKKSKCLFILGDIGSGKTTICKKVAYDVASKYKLKKKNGRIPILIPLNLFERTLSVYKTIVHTLNDSLSMKDPQHFIDLFNKRGSLLLILDGLETVSPSNRSKLSEELIRFGEYTKAKIIITCRTSYYQNENLHEYMFSLMNNELLAEAITIQPLDNKQINEYLDQSVYEKKDFLGFALSDKYELASRPLYLKLINKAIKVNAGETRPSISMMFDRFVSSLLKRENAKSRPESLTVDKKVYSKLAVKMYERGKNNLSESDLYMLPNEVTRHKLQALPFITKDVSGKIQFKFQSVLDYFIANKLAKDITEGRPRSIQRCLLSRETIQFLSSFDIPIPVLNKWKEMPPPTITSHKIFTENIDTLIRLCEIKAIEGMPSIRIRKLQLIQIKCFEDVLLEFTDNGHRGGISLVIGENGIGKSTILQAIAFCALGPDLASKIIQRPDVFLRDGADKGYIRATFSVTGLNNSDQMEVVIGLAVNRGNRDFELVVKGEYRSVNSNAFLKARLDIAFSGLFLAGYGPFRNLNLSDKNTSSSLSDPLLDCVDSLFNHRKILCDSHGLTRMVLGDGSPFSDLGAPKVLSNNARNAVLTALTSLLPEQDSGRFTKEGTYRSIFGNSLLSELSDGYRSTLSWIGHLLVHLLSTVKWSGNIEQISGLVLVDELDIHLHPSWQRIIVERLRKAFPKLQFIVSTHSPLVISDVDNSDLILLKGNQGAVNVERDLPSVRGWLVDQILTSVLFELPTTQDVDTERLVSKYATLLNEYGPDNGEVKSLERELSKRENKMRSNVQIDEDIWKMVVDATKKRLNKMTKNERSKMIAKLRLSLYS